jgi:putative ABC transport system permease protein
VRIALRELRRRSRRFLPTTAALALLVVLLLLLGGLLDGLYLGSTGALRAQESDLVAFSDSARKSTIRSRVDPESRATIEAVDGVASTYGSGVALLGAKVPGETDIADTAVIGYEGNVAGVPEPPPPGTAYADERLQAAGVDVGDVLLVGPQQVPIRVRGFVEDTNFLLQGALWVDADTWREALNASRPGAALGPGVFQTLWVAVEPGADPEQVAERIDAATGTTETITRDDAVLALPGIKEQRNTFNQILGVTFFVAGLVVALFFALMTLERLPLLAVLKALGASASQLAGGLVTQALVVTLFAFSVGGLVAVALEAVVPPGVPLQLTTSRAIFVAVGVIVMSLLGSAISLRRIVKTDPASAIGVGI